MILNQNIVQESKVYVIGGTGFSGSTLLSFLLGANDHCFATGEIHHLFDSEDSVCSNHQEDCKFWTNEIRNEMRQHPDFYNRCKEFIDLNAHSQIILHSTKILMGINTILDQGSQLDGIIVLFKRPEAFYKSISVHNQSSAGQMSQRVCRNLQKPV